MTQYSEGRCKTRDGISLCTREWLPTNVSACLVIAHGIGEHSGRYGNTAARFANRGYAVHALDHRGHGKSPGVRGHIRRFKDYIDDLLEFVRLVSERYPGKQPVLLGHSLGGLIATLFACQHPRTIRSLVLSSPLWGLSVPIPRWKRILSSFLSRLLPSITMRRPQLGMNTLSHDPEIEAQYHSDPLVHFKVSARCFVELQAQLKLLAETVKRLQAPTLVLQAGCDSLVSAQATEQIFKCVGADHKKLITYEGYAHEVLNELGRDQVFRDLFAWLDGLP